MLNRENLENINFGKDLILDCIDHIKSNYEFSEELNNQVLALENGYLALNSLENKMANFSESMDSNVDLETPAIETAMGIVNYYMEKDGKTIENIRVADEKEDDANFLRNDSNLAANITDEDKMAVAFSTNVRSFIDEFIPLLNNFVGFSTDGKTLIERAPTTAESKAKMDSIVQAMKNDAKLSWFGGSNNKSRSYIEKLRDELYYYLMVKKSCEVALECLKEKLPYAAYQAYVSANNVYYFNEEDYHIPVITKVKNNTEKRINEVKEEIREAVKELNFSDSIDGVNFSDTIPTMVLTNKAGNVYSLTHQDFSDIAEYAIENAGTQFSDYNDYYNKAFDLFTFSLSYVLKYLDNEDSISYQFSNKNKVNNDDNEKKLISDNTKSNIKHAAIGAGVGALLKGGYTAFKKSKDYDAYYENELSHGRTPMSKAKWLLANKDVQMSALVGGGLGAAGGLGYKYAKDKYWNGGDGGGDYSSGGEGGNGSGKANSSGGNAFAFAFRQIKSFIEKYKQVPEDEIQSKASYYVKEFDKICNKNQKVISQANIDIKKLNSCRSDIQGATDKGSRDRVASNIMDLFSKLGKYDSEDYDTNVNSIVEGIISGDVNKVKKALHIEKNNNSNILAKIKEINTTTNSNDKKERIKELDGLVKNSPNGILDGVVAITFSVDQIKKIVHSPKGNVLQNSSVSNIRSYTDIIDRLLLIFGIKSVKLSGFMDGDAKGASKYNTFIGELNRLKKDGGKVEITDKGHTWEEDPHDFLDELDRVSNTASIHIKGTDKTYNKGEISPTLNSKSIKMYFFGNDGQSGNIGKMARELAKHITKNHAGHVRHTLKQFFFSQYGYYPEDSDKRFKYMCFSMVSDNIIDVKALEVFNFDSNVDKKKTLLLTSV